MNRDNFDWETRRDAETLKDFKAINNDPERLRKAQSCIKVDVDNMKEALGIPTPPPIPGRKNPATIMKLNSNF